MLYCQCPPLHVLSEYQSGCQAMWPAMLGNSDLFTLDFQRTVPFRLGKIRGVFPKLGKNECKV
jgi:hypothetical protein